MPDLRLLYCESCGIVSMKTFDVCPVCKAAGLPTVLNLYFDEADHIERIEAPPRNKIIDILRSRTNAIAGDNTRRGLL